MPTRSLFEPERPTDHAGPTRYVRVVVERGIERTKRRRTPGSAPEGFTYRDDLGDLAIGERVEVPLGAGDTPAGGVVVLAGGNELLEGLPASRVKGVIRRQGGRVRPDLVELARWIAEYYVCPLGVALATLVPAAVKRDTGRRERELIQPAGTGVPDLSGETKGTRAAWAAITALEGAHWPMDPRELAGLAGLRSTHAIKRLVELGVMRSSREAVVEARALESPPAPLPLADEAGAWTRFTPTPDQARVVRDVTATLGSFAVHLVRGVTGSGKTEVYLRVIREAVARGTSAVVLVPEIALTPQTSARFHERFAAAGVAVLHSGLTAAQRHREWARAASGEARVVVGARSAVFAPVADLGVVVVDEEHESSYKQDQAPRYHARDVAIKRAQLAGCPVVLGSATPSLESWRHATAGPGAKYRLHELPARVAGRTLPRVEIVDLLAERRARTQAGDTAQRLIGPTLERAIDATLASGKQVILLLNRRGFGSYVYCPAPACKWVLSCDQCTSTLVYHKERLLPRGGVVRCHHCLSEQLLPALCPSCGGRLAMFGGGTQRAEEEVERLFAPRGIVRGETLLRLDSDTMRRSRDYFHALTRFASGEARVLLGTQMIAKGLDFPGVHLVGVIDADTAAALADFRADERTFQLLSQVAGRAGRGEDPGRVIVQTANPFSPPIRLAAAHDYATFARDELAIRARFGLPPVRRMAWIVSRDRDAAKAEERAGTLARALREGAEGGVEVRGPAPCPMFRIAAYYRFGIEVYAPSAGILRGALARARAAGLLHSDARVAVDVDPVAIA